MTSKLLICTLLATLPALAQADPAADLDAAVKKLAAAKNFTWSTSTAYGDREARTNTVKRGSGGHTLMSISMRDSSIEMLIRDGKAAFKTEEGWKLADAEAEGDDNRRTRSFARMAENYESPTKRLGELVANASDLTVKDGVISGKLSEEVAKEMMTWRGRGRGRDGGERQPPAITGANGSVVFTLNDGVLSKYELTLGGKMTFNDQERDLNRTTTVEFTDVGSTSFDIAEEAAGLLSK